MEPAVSFLTRGHPGEKGRGAIRRLILQVRPGPDRYRRRQHNEDQNLDADAMHLSIVSIAEFYRCGFSARRHGMS
jgi:hypothetical protein